MRQRSDDFDAAIRAGYELKVRFSVLVQRTPTLTFGPATVNPLLEGTSVEADADAAITRTLTFKYVDPSLRYVPRELGDLLAPPNEIRVEMGVDYGGGQDELLPVGVFGISKPDISVSDQGMETSLEGMDRARKVARAGYEKPYNIKIGTNYATAVTELIAAGYAPARFASTPTTATTPPLTFGLDEGNRWEDARKLAVAHARELFVDADGRFVLRPPPNPATQPKVWTYTDGADGTTLGVARSFDDEPGFNGVKARAESPALAAPLTAIRWDDDPLSPTYYLGDWGKVPLKVTTALVTTQEQLDEAAEILLQSILGTEEEVSFTCVPNPAHEVGDVIELRWTELTPDGEVVEVVSGRYVIQSFSLPLDGSAMSITCRRRRT